MATDEGWIEVFGIGSAILVRTVEGGAHFSAIGLLVEVDGSAGGAFGYFLVCQLSLTDTLVHKLSLLYYYNVYNHSSFFG